MKCDTLLTRKPKTQLPVDKRLDSGTYLNDWIHVLETFPKRFTWLWPPIGQFSDQLRYQSYKGNLYYLGKIHSTNWATQHKMWRTYQHSDSVSFQRFIDFCRGHCAYDSPQIASISCVYKNVPSFLSLSTPRDFSQYKDKYAYTRVLAEKRPGRDR